MKKKITFACVFAFMVITVFAGRNAKYFKKYANEFQAFSALKGSTSGFRSVNPLPFVKQTLDSIVFIADDSVEGKEIFTYNKAGYVTNISLYADSSNISMLVLKEIFGYDDSNLKTYEMTYSTGDSTVLLPRDSIAFNYLASDSIRETDYSYSSSSSAWKVSDTTITRYITTTDASGSPLSQTKYEYANSKWTAAEKTAYAYDTKERVTSLFTYDLEDSVMTLEDSTAFKYNSDSTTAVLISYSNDGDTTYMFSNSSQAILYYRMGTTSTGLSNTSANSSLTTYPNPTTNGFYVNAGETEATVRIYNLRGSLLLTQKVSGNAYVSVQGFPSGTYPVSITTAQGILNEKLIIK